MNSVFYVVSAFAILGGLANGFALIVHFITEKEEYIRYRRHLSALLLCQVALGIYSCFFIPWFTTFNNAISINITSFLPVLPRIPLFSAMYIFLVLLSMVLLLNCVGLRYAAVFESGLLKNGFGTHWIYGVEIILTALLVTGLYLGQDNYVEIGIYPGESPISVLFFSLGDASVKSTFTFLIISLVITILLAAYFLLYVTWRHTELHDFNPGTRKYHQKFLRCLFIQMAVMTIFIVIPIIGNYVLPEGIRDSAAPFLSITLVVYPILNPALLLLMPKWKSIVLSALHLDYMDTAITHLGNGLNR